MGADETTGPGKSEMVGVSDPSAISEYHAHIYYDPRTTRDRAERLRARVAAAFPQAKLGRWHDELVGPHTQSMFQIALILHRKFVADEHTFEIIRICIEIITTAGFCCAPQRCAAAIAAGARYARACPPDA